MTQLPRQSNDDEQMLVEPRIVRELPGWKGDACLVEMGGSYFVVSSVYAPFTGPETLVFRSDEDGHVSDYLEVAGGRGMSREEAIEDLREDGPR
jgi:hypothetical protein